MGVISVLSLVIDENSLDTVRRFAMGQVLDWVSQSGVVQGAIIGLVFAYLTAVLVLDTVARARTTTVNGWRAIRSAGRADNGPLVRAAMQKALPLVNVLEEAAYWTARTDSAGARLAGGREYRLRFAADGLPPNGAFWSLTATDAGGYMVGRRSGELGGRPSVDSHSGLATGADGSVVLLIGARRPDGTAPQNWLATPPGRFMLTLRVYLPGAAIVEGAYRVPPIERVRAGARS